VDSILEVRDISGQIQDSILREFEGLNQEVEKVIKHSSRVLSSLSRSIGVVVAPSFNRLSIRQVQFLQVGPKTLLVVLVGSSGIVQNRIIEVDEELNSSDLLRFNNYLNDIFEGLTISEIKVKLVEEMRQEKNMFDKMLSRALTLGHKVFGQEMPDDVYIEGRVNLFEYPEFSDVEAMKSLFKTFEDKSIIVKLLDKTLSANGVQIFIGSENEMRELEGCTLIASRYTRGSRPLGTLGVIGPIRLNYSQIIPVVDYTAKLVSQILETNS
jgi:heat-inducible transcriptional repressor